MRRSVADRRCARRGLRGGLDGTAWALDDAAVVMGFWGALLHAVHAAEEVREKLFFSRNDAGEFPDEGGFLGVVDGFQEAGFSSDEEQGGLFIDIGDEQGRKQEVLLEASCIEGFQEAFTLSGEVCEGQFLDLRDREAFPVLLVDFGVSVDGLLGGHGEEGGTDGEDVGGEFCRVETGDACER